MKTVIKVLLVTGIFLGISNLRAQKQTTYKSGFDTQEVVSHAQMFYHLDHTKYADNVPELIRFIDNKQIEATIISRRITDSELESGLTIKECIEKGRIRAEKKRGPLNAFLLGKGNNANVLRYDKSIVPVFKNVLEDFKTRHIVPASNYTLYILADPENENTVDLSINDSQKVTTETYQKKQFFPCPTMLRHPSYQSRNGGYIELMGIERWTNATVVNLKFFKYGNVNGLSVDNNFYLTDNSGHKYKARYVMNVAYDPDYTYISKVKNGMLHFQIVFPALPDGISSLDLTWPGSQGGFDFYGINVRSLFSQPAPSACNLPQTGYDASEPRRTASTVKIQINRYDTDYQFYDGMLTVYNKDLGGYGFIDEQGTVRTKFEWYYPFIRLGHKPRFGGGYCLVAKRIDQVEYWYIIDKNGNVTADLGKGVNRVTPFNKDGYANIVIKEGGEFKVMVIDGRGREVFPHLSKKPVYPSLYPYILDPFYEGLAAFKDQSSGNWGFINSTGKVVIPAQYEFVDKFSEGLAAVRFKATNSQASKWGYIDRTGKTVIGPMFEKEPGGFSESWAVVTKRNDKQVLMDKTGAIVSGEYNSITPFKQGRSIVDGLYVVDRDMNIVNGPFSNIEFYTLEIQPDSYCQGMFQAYSWTTRFIFPNGYFYPHTNVKHVSDKLLHYQDTNSKIDGFINYLGYMIFEFVESEF